MLAFNQGRKEVEDNLLNRLRKVDRTDRRRKKRREKKKLNANRQERRVPGSLIYLAKPFSVIAPASLLYIDCLSPSFFSEKHSL